MSREPHHTPSEEARKTTTRSPRPLRDGVVARLAFATARAREHWRIGPMLQARAQEVGALVQARQARSEADIRRGLEGDRQALQRARRRRNVAAELSALAHACVVAERTLGLRAHPGQSYGAVGLLEGRLVEMATGEGKTLMLALASVPVALAGRVHAILTANDYLAARDAEIMGPLYAQWGLSVGVVTSRTGAAERREAHACAVVYTTARELAADHLRDGLHYQSLLDADRRLVRELWRGEPLAVPGAVLRGIESVYVDEADHVLLDEAVTPLVISAPRKNALLDTLVAEVYAKARELTPERDFVANGPGGLELSRAAERRLAEDWAPRHPVLQLPRRRAAWVRQALEAIHVLKRDQHYLVRDGKVHIVDPSLGRVLPDRSWSHGLHQLIETKEGVSRSAPTHALASISFQRFFGRVPRLAGASATLAESAFELHRIFGLTVMCVAEHRPCRREVRRPQLYLDAERKFAVATERIAALHRAGQPVLVGTLSVRTSERVAGLLEQQGLRVRVLNAAQDQAEAAIIASAGERGAITVATNMAGRGVDIRLGPGVASLGGLCVVQLERNAARRIDRQLHGRCGRQGEPGRVEIFTSLDEDVLGGRNCGLVRWLAPLIDAAFATGVGQRLAERYLAHRQRGAERRAHGQRVALLRRDRQLEETIG